MGNKSFAFAQSHVEEREAVTDLGLSVDFGRAAALPQLRMHCVTRKCAA